MLQTILNYFGIAVFAASGSIVGVRKGFDLFGIAALGILTGVGGGVLRDVLAREIPLLMGPDDLYAVPAMLGSVTYVVIDYFGPQWIGVAVGAVVATVLRLAALAFNWRLPTGPRDLIADS